MADWIERWEAKGRMWDKYDIIHAGVLRFPQDKYPMLRVDYTYSECPSQYFSVTPERLIELMNICGEYGITIMPAPGNGSYSKRLFSIGFEFRDGWTEARRFWEDILEPQFLMEKMAEVS